MPKVFSVEDNKDIRDLLGFSLTGFGYEVTLFGCAEELFGALQRRDFPDIILLDIMLPGMDGTEALKRLKADADTGGIPVILLTAKAAEMNIVQGLECGADDYITKPFSVVELVARIKANLRKKEKAAAVRSGSIRMSLSSREAFISDVPLRLSLKEFDLLYALVLSPNVVLKREKLLSDIWGYGYAGETRTLDMHIRALRAKLRGEAGRIVTVRGVGYKLTEQ